VRGPSVSIVLPTLNEQGYIRDCLDSLRAQDYEGVEEILVVDGGSTDETRAIVAAAGAPVRLVENPRVTAAAAMNIGVAEAKGEMVVRADAHTLYAGDYVRRCVEVMAETGAQNVGGLMRPVGTTRFGRSVAAATTTPVGVGPGRFHYSDRREEVDTVYLGSFWTQTLHDLGGYDESKLQWGAEDQELNFRLRQAGGRIVLDPSIQSTYFVRETPKLLWRQYRNYGVCKASTLVKHRTLPTPRPLAPAVLVAAAAVGAVAGRGWARIAIPALHAIAVAAALKARPPQVVADPVRTFVAVEVCHWSYGLGFWSGLARAVRGREFQSRPRGHR
jgi:GT2 family glycosyltransferase